LPLNDRLKSLQAALRIDSPLPPPPQRKKKGNQENKARVLGETGIQKLLIVLEELRCTFHTKKNWYPQRSRYARGSISSFKKTL